MLLKRGGVFEVQELMFACKLNATFHVDVTTCLQTGSCVLSRAAHSPTLLANCCYTTHAVGKEGYCEYVVGALKLYGCLHSPGIIHKHFVSTNGHGMVATVAVNYLEATLQRGCMGDDVDTGQGEPVIPSPARVIQAERAALAAAVLSNHRGSLERHNKLGAGCPIHFEW